ncbi:DUF3999 family protein [Saccharibacillus kuerlensis]|uniref:Uncharacterized protein n=1 Tax=Saccharibacillus kuerlensis TaxID=459527 RepID=A0ABQ2KV11_9BACL|nr:DUF3999 family protein [Saccharibacillus kuerlensis]GGN94165.1 hypothetical protein GCM10010969_08630 [Saccharibacillus kuerlensis]
MSEFKARLLTIEKNQRNLLRETEMLLAAAVMALLSFGLSRFTLMRNRITDIYALVLYGVSCLIGLGLMLTMPLLNSERTLNGAADYAALLILLAANGAIFWSGRQLPAKSRKRRGSVLGAVLCTTLLLTCTAGISELLPGNDARVYAGAADVQTRAEENDSSGSDLWQFSKEIAPAEGSRYQSLFLDADVYARAQDDLGDVRIVNAMGQFIPYYIDTGEEGERGTNRDYPLERIARQDGEQESRLDFRVVPSTESEDVRGSLLTFELPAASFLAAVTLEGSYDGQRWERVTEGELYSTNEGTSRNVIELEGLEKYGYYRLIIPNGGKDLDINGGTLTDVGAAVSGEAFRRTKELPFNVEPNIQMSEIVLYNAGRLKIDRIKINASASDGSSGFSRLYAIDKVPGGGLNTRILSPDRLARLELNGTAIDDTEIRLEEPIRSEQPRVVIDNAGNPPLKIQSLEVGYRVDRLVFEDTDTGPYRLVYGAEAEQESPEYDIEAFRPEIESQQPKEASLGPETAEQFVPPSMNEAPLGESGTPEAIVGPRASLQIVFNSVLIAVALLLIVWLGRKLRRR